MFTGLIEDVGRVVRLEPRGSGARMLIATGLPADGFPMGASVAVNGVCLTVVAMAGGTLEFDVSPESLGTAGFARLLPGSRVNLERALRLSDRLGGHLVTGHVDCIATVVDRREISGNTVFSFRIPVEYSCYLVEKGSVTVDGVSLTVNEVATDRFSVNVIPHTARATTLHLLRGGDEVNIEVDILAKYIERLLKGKDGNRQGGLTLDSLAQAGFL